MIAKTKNTNNTNVSLSNAFVQEPQSPFSIVETKLFLAVLLQLHANDIDFKPLYCIKISSMMQTTGNNYVALAEAIEAIRKRRWFGQPLFLRIRHIHKESVIEFSFNPALKEHLLGHTGYYTCIDVVALQEAGLKSPVAWRLLWLIRSFYRPKSQNRELTFSHSELEDFLFAGNSPFALRIGLKQHVDSAIKALVAVGLVVTAKTYKRGSIAKGITFTIPSLTLPKSKDRGKKLVDAVASVASKVVESVQDVVKEVAVVAAVAAPMVVHAAPSTNLEVPEPITENSEFIKNKLFVNTDVTESVTSEQNVTNAFTKSLNNKDFVNTNKGNLGGYINQVVNVSASNRSNTSTPVPTNTLVVTGRPLTLREKVERAKVKMKGYKLEDWQIEIFVRHFSKNLHLEKAFFGTLHKAQVAIENPTSQATAIKNNPAYIVTQMQAALGVQCCKS